MLGTVYWTQPQFIFFYRASALKSVVLGMVLPGCFIISTETDLH